MVTRVRYVVIVNDVIIDPSKTNTYPPTVKMLQDVIEKIPSSSLTNYFLCGVGAESLIDSLPTSTYYFPLVLNKYAFDRTDGSAQKLINAIRVALISTNPLFGQNTFNVIFDNSFETLYYPRNASELDPNAM